MATMNSFLLSTTFLFIIPTIISRYLWTLSNDTYFLGSKNTFNVTTIAALSHNKTILVTGANSGLGYSSVKHLTAAGTARLIIMACRDRRRCEDAKQRILEEINESEAAPAVTNNDKNVALEVVDLDLSSLSSIQKLATVTLPPILQQYSPSSALDVLLNNAGVMAVPHSVVSDTNTDIQMHVNHLGHFSLTSLLLPYLRASSYGGRVVSVSSIMGALGFSLRWDDNNNNGVDDDVNIDDGTYYPRPRQWGVGQVHSLLAYASSKRCNLIFAQGFNERFHNNVSDDSNDDSVAPVSAVAAHPGYSRTALPLNGWYFVPSAIKKFFVRNKVLSMNADDGALPQLRAGLDLEGVAAGDYVAPAFFLVGGPVVVGTVMSSWHHLFWPVREGGGDVEKLWKFSEEVIKRNV